MKKIIYSVCVFCLVLSSCSSSTKEDNKSTTTEAKTEISNSTPRTIKLEDDVTSYKFDNWDNTSVIVQSTEGLKLLGLYDENNDIISLENISLKEIQEIIKDRNLSEPIKIILKIENEKGQIIDYTLTKE